MSEETELKKRLIGQVITGLDSDGNPRPGKEPFVAIAVADLLSYVGATAIQVIFRQNFGKTAINKGEVIFSSIVLFAVSIFSFYKAFPNPNEVDPNANYEIPFVTGILFAAFASLVLYRGITEFAKAQKNEKQDNDSGDSYLLGFLSKDKWWTKSRVQKIAEPLLVLALGLSYVIFDLIGGIALLACGISIWVREALNTVILKNKVQEAVNTSTNQERQTKPLTAK